MTAAGDEAREQPFGVRLWAQLHALAKLSGPVMLSRAGILTMAIVDIAMVGRYSTTELGYASLGTALFVPIMVTGIGLQIGLVAIVAREFGAGRLAETGRAWRRSLPWAAMVGALGFALCWFGETWLLLFGHDPELAAGAGAVARAIALGVPMQILYVVCGFYLEGTQRPLPSLVTMAAANVLNAALNYVLIWGHLGLPELGAVGSAIATSAVRVFMFGALFVYIVTRPDAHAYGIRPRMRGLWGPGGWAAGAEMRRLSFAAGAATLCEAAAFGAVSQFAGFLGVEALAAYSIAHNVNATVFMAALGLAVGTGVLVGAAWGRGEMGEARFAGWTGVAAVIGVMAAIGAALALFPGAAAAIYTNDGALIEATAPLIALVGLIVIADGAQVVAGQAVRALGDAWTATALFFLAFIGVMTPLAYLLGIEFGYGATGLLAATFVGCAVSAILQAARFAHVARKREREAAFDYGPVGPV